MNPSVVFISSLRKPIIIAVFLLLFHCTQYGRAYQNVTEVTKVTHSAHRSNHSLDGHVNIFQSKLESICCVYFGCCVREDAIAFVMAFFVNINYNSGMKRVIHCTRDAWIRVNVFT